MKEELLKSVAQPVKVFYVPFSLFMLNFAINLVLMLFFVILGKGIYILWLVFLFMILHLVFIIVGKKEPHIDSIIRARQNIKVKTKNVLKENGNKFIA